MKGFFVFLFVITFPIVILLMTFLYGGFSSVSLKQELRTAQVYPKIQTYISSLTMDETEQPAKQFSSVIKQRFTSLYIQQKTEELVDTSGNWITNASSTIPTISFKELKDDITTQYPELLPSLQEMQKELENQPIDAPIS